MGWDITYHPVKADEIKSIYFASLNDPDRIQSIAILFDLDDFYTEQLKSRIEEARNLGDDIPFNKGHVFYIAIVFGFLRKHRYIRGGAFSFLADDPIMKKYISDWQDLVPEAYRKSEFENCLTENYCGGVYISNKALTALRADYETNEYVQSKLDETFSYGRLAIFWQAVDNAIEEGCGLVEASEVVEPNPLDLNASRSFSNLFKCEHDGAVLYAAAVGEQLGNAINEAKITIPESNDTDKSIKKHLFAERMVSSFINTFLAIGLLVLIMSPSFTSGGRFFINCILCWFLYKRKNWARKIYIILLSLGGIAGAFLLFDKTLDLMASLLLGTLLVYFLGVAAMLAFSKRIISYFDRTTIDTWNKT